MLSGRFVASAILFACFCSTACVLFVSGVFIGYHGELFGNLPSILLLVGGVFLLFAAGLFVLIIEALVKDAMMLYNEDSSMVVAAPAAAQRGDFASHAPSPVGADGKPWFDHPVVIDAEWGTFPGLDE